MIDPIIQQLIGLFTPAEWKAMVWMLLATIATTHTLKVIWRLSPIKGGGHAGVNLIAVGAGFLAAWTVWPHVGSIPWYMAGVIAGPASSVVFKLGFALLKKVSPDAAAALNADRRTVNLGPPSNEVAGRKDDQ